MKVVDNIIFNNEKDMLNFRLHELDSIVDVFNIAEGQYTFQGNEKKLCFNINDFPKFKDKIIYTVGTSRDNYSWSNENALRDTLSKGISSLNLQDDDIIMLSDVDEIPDTDILKEIILDPFKTSHTFNHETYYYNLNCKQFSRIQGTCCINNGEFTKTYKTFSNLRAKRLELNVIPGGWHFSYFGDVEFIRNKLQSFSHTEYNQEKYYSDENILYCIKNTKDLFYQDPLRGDFLVPRPENAHLPKNVDLLNFAANY
jgi:beta-1,4-mannosyl-glycoprotein beta-1,4-N-acetylglucosaminyltransferase